MLAETGNVIDRREFQATVFKVGASFKLVCHADFNYGTVVNSQAAPTGKLCPRFAGKKGIGVTVIVESHVIRSY